MDAQGYSNGGEGYTRCRAESCDLPCPSRRRLGLAPRGFALLPMALSVFGRPNVLGVSCAAGPASRSRSGAAVAANDVRRTEWRIATAVTPPRWRWSSRLGRRTEAGPCQLHTKVSRRCVASCCRIRGTFLYIGAARPSTTATNLSSAARTSATLFASCNPMLRRALPNTSVLWKAPGWRRSRGFTRATFSIRRRRRSSYASRMASRWHSESCR